MWGVFSGFFVYLLCLVFTEEQHVLVSLAVSCLAFGVL